MSDLDDLKDQINKTFDQSLPEEKHLFLQQLKHTVDNIHTIRTGLIAVENDGDDNMMQFNFGSEVTLLGMVSWIKLVICKGLEEAGCDDDV